MFLSFTPSQAGQHQVSVTFRGKHLQGSPFTLEVVDRPAIVYRRDYSKVGDQPVSRFGSNGAGDGQFQYPRSIACNSTGEIVVADWNNSHIQVFDRNGKFLFKFGSNGNGNGQFDHPQGVTVDQRNNQIVVADSHNIAFRSLMRRAPSFVCLGRVVRVMGNSGIHEVFLSLLYLGFYDFTCKKEKKER